ncbi:MAG: PepSY domain-containing protein [Cypionkella sp.]
MTKSAPGLKPSPKTGFKPGLNLATLVLLGLATPLAAADARCKEAMADWQPRDAVIAMAAEQGWTLRRIKIDDGCYELYARDADGVEFEVSVNPATLAILKKRPMRVRGPDDDVQDHDADHN